MEIDNNTDHELENLTSCDNITQLNLLKKEIGHITVHRVTPPDEWFDERFHYINTYLNLNWSELVKRFHNKDEYIYNTARYIIIALNELVEERGTKTRFHIPTYRKVLHDIHDIWTYYDKVYMGDETDDIVDLITGITF